MVTLLEGNIVHVCVICADIPHPVFGQVRLWCDAIESNDWCGADERENVVISLRLYRRHTLHSQMNYLVGSTEEVCMPEISASKKHDNERENLMLLQSAWHMQGTLVRTAQDWPLAPDRLNQCEYLNRENSITKTVQEIYCMAVTPRLAFRETKSSKLPGFHF